MQNLFDYLIVEPSLRITMPCVKRRGLQKKIRSQCINEGVRWTSREAKVFFKLYLKLCRCVLRKGMHASSLKLFN